MFLEKKKDFFYRFFMWYLIDNFSCFAFVFKGNFDLGSLACEHIFRFERRLWLPFSNLVCARNPRSKIRDSIFAWSTQIYDSNPKMPTYWLWLVAKCEVYWLKKHFNSVFGLSSRLRTTWLLSFLGINSRKFRKFTNNFLKALPE